MTINVESTVQTERIGDAPARVTSSTQFATAWSDPLLHGIRHTDDADAAAPTWSAVQFNTLNSAVLSGGDIYNGDLGVSGQVAATSSVRQEIDGTGGATLRPRRAGEQRDGGSVAPLRQRRRLDALRGRAPAPAGLKRKCRRRDGLRRRLDDRQQDRDPGRRRRLQHHRAQRGRLQRQRLRVRRLRRCGRRRSPRRSIPIPQGRLHGSEFLVDWIEVDFQVPLVGVADPIGG